MQRPIILLLSVYVSMVTPEDDDHCGEEFQFDLPLQNKIFSAPDSDERLLWTGHLDSRESCLEKCCKTASCNIASFNQSLVPNSIKNCFLYVCYEDCQYIESSAMLTYLLVKQNFTEETIQQEIDTTDAPVQNEGIINDNIVDVINETDVNSFPLDSTRGSSSLSSPTSRGSSTSTSSSVLPPPGDNVTDSATSQSVNSLPVSSATKTSTTTTSDFIKPIEIPLFSNATETTSTSTSNSKQSTTLGQPQSTSQSTENNITKTSTQNSESTPTQDIQSQDQEIENFNSAATSSSARGSSTTSTAKNSETTNQNEALSSKEGTTSEQSQIVTTGNTTSAQQEESTSSGTNSSELQQITPTNTPLLTLSPTSTTTAAQNTSIATSNASSTNDVFTPAGTSTKNTENATTTVEAPGATTNNNTTVESTESGTSLQSNSTGSHLAVTDTLLKDQQYVTVLPDKIFNDTGFTEEVLVVTSHAHAADDFIENVINTTDQLTTLTNMNQNITVHIETQIISPENENPEVTYDEVVEIRNNTVYLGNANITFADTDQLKEEEQEYRVLSAALIAALSFGILFFFAVLVLIGKRCFDSWQRRHYSRIDYLVNGMYN